MFETTWELLLLEKNRAEAVHLIILELALEPAPNVAAQVNVPMVDLLACEVEIVKGTIAAIFAKFKRSAIEHLSLPV